MPIVEEASLMHETPKRSTRDERIARLLDAGDIITSDEPGPILYAHTVFCQTGLPYRNPGDVREWERANGVARLKILAGEALHPETGEFVQLGLPYGPKPRLIPGSSKWRGIAATVTGSRDRPQPNGVCETSASRPRRPDDRSDKGPARPIVGILNPARLYPRRASSDGQQPDRDGV